MKILLTSLLLLSIWFCGQAADFSTSTKEVAKAMEELKQIKHFAFGGVGDPGQTSIGELAFRKIYSDRNAKSLFQEVSEQGTSAAKLYALVALRRINKREYQKSLVKLKSDDSDVSTISGCILSEAKVRVVADSIAAGDYDSFIPKAMRKTFGTSGLPDFPKRAF